MNPPVASIPQRHTRCVYKQAINSICTWYRDSEVAKACSIRCVTLPAVSQVTRILANLAHRYDRTIVCTIHQPSSDIFHLADDLVVLSEGQVGGADPGLLGEKAATGTNVWRSGAALTSLFAAQEKQPSGHHSAPSPCRRVWCSGAVPWHCDGDGALLFAPGLHLPHLHQPSRLPVPPGAASW